MMYTVKQLTEMYGTTRQTIHTKFKNPLLAPYIIKKDNEVRFDPDGINALNIIMSESKVALRQNDNKDNDKMTQLTEGNYIDNDQNNIKNTGHSSVKNDDKFRELYIEQLHETIKELKERCERAEKQYDELVNITIKPKLLEAPKKRFWLF